MALTAALSFATALSFAAALSPAFAAALPANETARVLGGLEAAPAFAPHARTVTDRWEDYERRIGRPMREWAGAELAPAPGATERIARYEQRPRKLFVSGRDGVEYVTALRSRVAGVAAPLTARHDPGRAALMTLTLAADGTLKALDLDRSSGSAAFDRGLRESVRRATPFPPLPETIRKQADLLVVTLQLPER